MDNRDVRIILELANHSMNISEAAKVVYLHRNTIVYRIKRIKRITGLDPTNFYDLCKLVQMVKERGANDG